MADQDIVERWRVETAELSGLGLRRHGPAGEPELLAVGDREFRVLTAGLHAGTDQGASPELHDVVEKYTDGASSQWEAVTSDGSGRVFVLQEHPGHVFVFEPGLDALVTALELKVPVKDDGWERKWHEDDNARGEALLLMQRGHVLVIKQKDPIVLIEFGPKKDKPNELDGDPFLTQQDTFAVPKGPLHPLRVWKLGDHRFKSVSDASHVGGRIYLLSAKSNRIARLGALGDAGKVSFDGGPWMLSQADIEQPEGLVVLDEDATPIVAADLGEGVHGDNLFRLSSVAT